LKRLINIIKDISFTIVIKLYSICESCIKDQQTRKFSKQLQEFVIEFLNCIDLDVDEFIISLAIKDKKYFVLFIDKVFDCC